MSSNLRVGPDELRHASATVRGLIDEFNAVMQTYLTQTQHNSGAGGWSGPASMANMGSTEEIHRAQFNLSTRWGGLCDQLEKAAANYESQEQLNTQRAASVGHSL